MVDTVQSPLLQQVQTILGNMGFKPTYPEARLYMKSNPAGQKLSVEFYRVTDSTIQKTGLPIQKPMSHMKFITEQARYLFG